MLMRGWEILERRRRRELVHSSIFSSCSRSTHPCVGRLYSAGMQVCIALLWIALPDCCIALQWVNPLDDIGQSFDGSPSNGINNQHPVLFSSNVLMVVFSKYNYNNYN